MARTGVFGGSFNPPHIGHVRMAVEAAEALSLERVLLVPVGRHPLKGEGPMLPFEMRWHLLGLAFCDMPGFTPCSVEAVMEGPSFTVKTLERLGNSRPLDDLSFIMGSDDFLELRKWHEGERLPELANLVVMPRPGAGEGQVAAFVKDFWPGAQNESETVWALPGGRRIYYLADTPILDIRATLIRERFLQGRSIRGLTPLRVERALTRQKPAVLRAWGGKE